VRVVASRVSERSSARRCFNPPSGPDRFEQLPDPAGTTLIIVVFGPGGVGKGTVIKRLLEGDDSFWLSRSWTTRARRPGEPEDAYNFVDRATFERNIAAGGFFEWANVLDDLYGTPLPDAPEGRDIVLEIDIQGADQVAVARPDALRVLMLAPSVEAQTERLRARGDPEEQVQRRVELGRTEEQDGRALAHHVIVNDEVESSADRLLAIIEGARNEVLPRP
jgi:guanylate kinase